MLRSASDRPRSFPSRASPEIRHPPSPPSHNACARLHGATKNKGQTRTLCDALHAGRAHLTRGAPLADFDVLLPLELQANGVKKQQLALLSTMLLPISMASRAVVSRFFRQGASPMRIFVGAAYARLLQGALATGLVFLLRTCVPAGAGVPLWLLGLGLLVAPAHGPTRRIAW
jgi:type IV secretory pathway TrbD component